MNTLLLEALKARYKADELDAVARLDVYLKNAAGIGEHPQITEEMDKLVQQYVDAKDKHSAVEEIENRLFNKSLKS
jgi:uncharacterized protein HemY